MPGLWRYTDGTREGKYLVQRRDGTVPAWPWFVVGAADPAAPAALREYARVGRHFGFDESYCADIEHLADEFSAWRADNTTGDPGAPKHRTDNPDVVARMNDAMMSGGGSA